MSRYPILLLDADNTLFDFNAGNRRAFSEVCRVCRLPDSDQLFHAYEKINDELWGAFDRGECSKDFLVVERFRRYLQRFGLQADPVQCNDIHLESLKTNTALMPHLPYISDAFISEEAGASKPSAEYFDYVFSRIPDAAREDCLLVGDSVSSDIQGANNYGLACCWYNPNGLAAPDGLRIDYEIQDLRQLLSIVNE